ncbi:hypothetical protein CL621_02715 [archaeon]|nr:hypothetical protein [archaeon]|tara:strand:- start:344 stop:637 length:294 start_codon:yes stop_codon:yes gene_type:complete
MKKGVIIGIIIIILLIVIGIYFYTNQTKEICVQAGEYAGNPSIKPGSPDSYVGECCEGLSRISECSEEELGCGEICSDCGNGICEEWENDYNCPDDC